MFLKITFLKVGYMTMLHYKKKFSC